jgi:hypothetical protein
MTIRAAKIPHTHESLLDGGVLTADAVPDHNDLNNIQGGVATEYYHLTSAEHTELSTWVANVTLTATGGMTLGDDLDMAGKDILGPGAIRDAVGNIQVYLPFTLFAVNHLSLQNTAAGTGAYLATLGADTDIDINLNPKGTGVVNVLGDITLTGTVDGRDLQTDGTKLDGIEALADVTDTANVAAAGAIMDGDFTGNGLMVRTGAGSYTNRSIAVTDAKLTVSNADGTAGNPTLGFGTVALADLNDGATAVTASAVIADNVLVKGDGGTRGVQATGISVTDSDAVSGMTQLTVGTLILGVTLSGSGANNVKLGDALDCNSKDIIDASRAYVKVSDGLYVTGTMAIGQAPVSFAGFVVNPSGASIYMGVFGGVTYTGASANVYGVLFSTSHEKTNPTSHQTAWGCNVAVTNKGIGLAAKNIISRGVETQAINTSAQTSATANIYAYGLYVDETRPGSGVNAAGNFYGYGLFVADVLTPAGTPTSNQEWCALFEGPVQVNSDQPLILEGSTTSKGDTYLVYDSAGVTLDFFLGGTEEMNIAAGFVDIVNELKLSGDLNHDGTNIGFFTAVPVPQAAAYTQAYAAVNRTLAAYTADDESGAYTGIDNAQGGTPYATVVDLNALRVAYENLRALCENSAQMINAVVDDLQAYGLVQ